MSLLSIGASCSTCHTVDFLPTPCPSCHLVFCSSHISAHRPCRDRGAGYKESNAVAGPSSFAARGACELGGCGRRSIEGIAGLGGEGDGGRGKGEGEKVAKDVRCPGCGGAYCVEHRAQTSHDCSAPLAHNARHDAFISRKAQAQAVLARTFPDQAGRVIPKPPPAKDVQLAPPSSKSTPIPDWTSLAAASAGGAAALEGVDGGSTSAQPAKSKSKEEKLWEIHVRKIKSLSTPLRGSPSGIANEERRYFEWGSGDREGVGNWEEGGKWAGKLERNSVLASMPLGKLLDLIRAAAKIPPPKASADPTQIWGLVLLDARPNAPTPRRAVPLRTDLPVGVQIPDGTTIVLCKG